MTSKKPISFTLARIEEDSDGELDFDYVDPTKVESEVNPNAHVHQNEALPSDPNDIFDQQFKKGSKGLNGSQRHCDDGVFVEVPLHISEEKKMEISMADLKFTDFISRIGECFAKREREKTSGIKLVANPAKELGEFRQICDYIVELELKQYESYREHGEWKESYVRLCSLLVQMIKVANEDIVKNRGVCNKNQVLMCKISGGQIFGNMEVASQKAPLIVLVKKFLENTYQELDQCFTEIGDINIENLRLAKSSSARDSYMFLEKGYVNNIVEAKKHYKIVCEKNDTWNVDEESSKKIGVMRGIIVNILSTTLQHFVDVTCRMEGSYKDYSAAYIDGRGSLSLPFLTELRNNLKGYCALADRYYLAYCELKKQQVFDFEKANSIDGSKELSGKVEFIAATKFEVDGMISALDKKLIEAQTNICELEYKVLVDEKAFNVYLAKKDKVLGAGLVLEKEDEDVYSTKISKMIYGNTANNRYTFDVPLIVEYDERSGSIPKGKVLISCKYRHCLEKMDGEYGLASEVTLKKTEGSDELNYQSCKDFVSNNPTKPVENVKKL